MKLLSRVGLFATPWTVAYQAPQSLEFSRQEYWSGLPFPSPRIFTSSGLILLLVPVNISLRFISLGKGWSWVKERTYIRNSTPISIWSTWALIKSALERFQTSDSFDDSDNDSVEKLQNQYREASHQIIFNIFNIYYIQSRLYTKIRTGQKSTRKNLSFDSSRFQTPPLFHQWLLLILIFLHPYLHLLIEKLINLCG